MGFKMNSTGPLESREEQPPIMLAKVRFPPSSIAGMGIFPDICNNPVLLNSKTRAILTFHDNEVLRHASANRPLRCQIFPSFRRSPTKQPLHVGGVSLGLQQLCNALIRATTASERITTPLGLVLLPGNCWINHLPEPVGRRVVDLTTD